MKKFSISFEYSKEKNIANDGSKWKKNYTIVILYKCLFERVFDKVFISNSLEYTLENTHT